MAEAEPVQKYVAEFVGTFLLVFTVGCNVLSNTQVWAGVSIASVLMVAIYSLGDISGANFNPAVSFALFVSKAAHGPGMDFMDFVAYVCVQVCAGVAAAMCYAVLFWNAFNLGPAKGFGFLSAGLCELLYTCMLCFVVLNVAAARKWSDKREENPQYFGLAIGFVIIAGAYGAGAVSGGCFNPAVAIAIDLSSAGMGFGWCVVYVIFEIIGAFVAVVLFRLVRPGDFGETDCGDGGLTERLVSEFVGTYFLVLTVGLNVLGSSAAGAFSIAASLMCMIYALGDVSGAQFNPAVTLAVSLSGNFPEVNGHGKGLVVALYMIVQMIGASVAGYTYMIIHKGHTFPLGPAPGYGWGHVFAAEAVFTFTLCYVVLCTAVVDNKSTKTFFGLAIGSCVTVGGFAIGSISGGSLNPAVSFGIASVSGHPGKAFWYSCFEFIGGAVAAVVLSLTHPRQKTGLPS